MRKPARPLLRQALPSRFIAPGGTDCALQGDDAVCTVESIDESFVLPQGGGSAYTESGAAVLAGRLRSVRRLRHVGVERAGDWFAPDPARIASSRDYVYRFK